MKFIVLSLFILAASCGGPTKEETKTTTKVPVTNTTQAKPEAPKPIVYKDLIIELKNPDNINDVKALITNSGLQWDNIAFQNGANAIAIIKVPEDKTSFWTERLTNSGEFKAVIPKTEVALDDLIKKASAKFFNIRKTECFGDCPVFEITIDEEGNATYNGIKYTKVAGVKKFKLTDKQLEKFLQKMEKNDFSTYQKAYDNPNITDLPSTFISHKGDQVKIRLWKDIPKDLIDVHEYVQDMLYDMKYLE